MEKLAVDALFIPTSDAHNSEYVAPSLQRRAFVSNFHGSAGSVLITEKEALLWTDGRYWLEASQSLYPSFSLMKYGELGVPSMESWVNSHLGDTAKVGVDPFVLTVAEWDRLSSVIQLVPVPDLVLPMMAEEAENPSWKDADSIEQLQIYARPVKYTGESCKERRGRLLKKLEEASCDLIVLSALDEVAWVTNLRGADVPCNPVFYAYAIVTPEEEKVLVFTDLAKVSEELRRTTAEEIMFLPYEAFKSSLEKLVRSETGGKPRRVLVDELQTSKAVFNIIKEGGAKPVRVPCGPAQALKALKTPVEMQGFRDCHVRDGAALTQYLAWLHEEIAVKGTTNLNEFDAATKLEWFRRQNDLFVQLSFPSISSSGPNGAIIHYHPTEKKSDVIRREQLYLIDSGAQYWDGTTDTTRTVCFDTPTEEEQERYTLVLKGHISLNQTVFPKGTTGHRLDVLARKALWDVGLNYAHGTGHGVGSFLCVHEGPQGIGMLPTPTKAFLEPTMTISNEPGFYKDGGYGIRIENVEEIVEKPLKYSADGFLGFSSLTLVPLCRELIDVSLLTDAEKKWVNQYHTRVVDALLPLLKERADERAIAYLHHHTQPI